MPTTPISGAAAGALAFAFALALTLASPARADAVEERTQDVIDALRAGDAAAARELLDAADLAAALPDRPALVHVVCDRAYRFDDALHAAPEAARRALAERLVALAALAHDRAPEDARGDWALAGALVVRERWGPAEGAAAWLRAADLLEEAHERAPGDGEALGYAATFLLEGAAALPDDRYALQKRAAAVAKTAQRTHEGSVSLARTMASAHLWGARVLLPVGRRAAKAALRVVFSQLGDHVRREPPDAASAALWNDAVTLGARAKFAFREHYVCAPASALGGAVTFDVPISPRWTVTEVPAGESYGAYVYVTQTDDAGRRVRQIIFRNYSWALSYSFIGPNQVKGDNVKRVAKGLRDLSAERVFAPGAETSPVRKVKVGKDFTGNGFEVSGKSLADEPEPLALHGYCARGKRQATFGFLVYVYGEEGELDPETEFVLSRMREPED